MKGQSVIHMGKMKLESLPHNTFKKMDAKWIKHVNGKARQSYNTFRTNIAEQPHDLKANKKFLNKTKKTLHHKGRD